MQRYDQAIVALKSLTDQYPNEMNVWYLLAVAHYGQNQLTEALAATDRCIKINPRFQVGYWLKGIVLAVQSKLSDALRAYDRAVQVAPTKPGGYFQRGRFLVMYRSGDEALLTTAVEDLKRSLALGAPSDMAHGFLGLAYRKLGNPHQAVHHFRLVLDRAPDSLDAVKELVSLYQELGQPEKTEEVLAIARGSISSSEPDEIAELSLIEAHHAIAVGAAPKDVESHFRNAIAAQPDPDETRLEYARWLETVGRNADAVPVLTGGLKRPPYNPDLAAQLAWALADSGVDLDQARHWYEVARQHHPQNPYLSDTGAWIEYRKGNYTAALDALQPGLPYAEQVPEIAYHAGAIHAKLGNRPEALHFLRLSLQIGRPFNGQEAAKALLESMK